MKTLKDLKDRLVVGAELTIVESSRWHPALGVPRKIQTRQTLAIMFEPFSEGTSGSWLDFPKRSEVTLDTNSFTITTAISTRTYEFTGSSRI